MKIEPFEVEQWMDAHETNCTHNIAETCAASLSLSSLLSLSSNPPSPLSFLCPSTPQTYGHIRGDPELLDNLSRFYEEDFEAHAENPTTPKPSNPTVSPQNNSTTNGNGTNGTNSTTTSPPSHNQPPRIPPSQILTTPGAIAANFLVFYTLISPGDHVIVQHPTYQQLYSVPEALGAQVSLWKGTVKKKEGENCGTWEWDLGELEGLVEAGRTRMIVVNNPNNPTGSLLPTPHLHALAALAQKNNLLLLSDEVYRPLFHSIENPPPSLLSLPHPYKNILATGSLSKAFSLAGIRVGWIASRSRELTERLAAARDYTCISVGQSDQRIAAFALSAELRPRLLQRNLELARANLGVLERFVECHKGLVEFVRPVAGTTAFLRFSTRSGGKPVDSVVFCTMLLEKTGVLFLPGDKGFGKGVSGVREGWVCAGGEGDEGRV